MKKNKRREHEGIGLKKISEKVPKHHHCPVCGMPISLDTITCSEKCEETFRKARRARYHALVPILILITAIIIFIIRLFYKF